ncbi:MAG: hypothetical protein GOV00_01400 [Candidatus Altiarchaeota archaeon]|nr:hypothetical protein [Candidatus Altiarchaeota archaeon]
MLKIKWPKYDIFQKIMTTIIVLITLLGFYYAYQITQFAFIGVSDFLIFIGAVNIIALEVMLLLVIVVYEVSLSLNSITGRTEVKEKIERAITAEEFARAYAKFGGKKSRVKKVKKTKLKRRVKKK